MGMAASQATFGMLTRRRNDIARQLTDCSLQKTSLSRDMKRVTKNYQEALGAKVFKWSNNAGATYVDLSYSNLMKPGAANQNKPYLITDANSRVVLDSKYRKYAEMISPDGIPGGNYASHRTEILASLTGLSSEDIDKSNATSAAVQAAADKVNALQEETDKLEAKCTMDAKNTDFLEKCFGNITGFSYSGGGNNNIAADYKFDSQQPGQWRLDSNPSGAKSRVKELLDQITNNVSGNLKDRDLEAFKKAADATYKVYSDYVDSAGADCADRCDMSIESCNGNNYCIRICAFIDCLLRNYRSNGGSASQSSQNTEVFYYDYVNKDSETYKEYEAKKAELEAAKAEYKTAVDSDNQVFTSANESEIAFYDQIFSAIADNGWTCNPDVEDGNYLNQMLQSNQYFITTIETETDKNGKEFYTYDSGVASTFDKIIAVNDTDTQNEALVKYEYEKAIISEKESRIDERMQNLKTEQSAINNMMKGVETVRNDNIERNFSIMS